MAFGNMNERGANRRPMKPSQPTIPAPPAQPAGALKPNIAEEVPLKPGRPGRQGRPVGGPKVNPNAAPDPTKGALPPRFANMVKGGMTEAQARQKWARSLQNRGKAGPGIPGGGGTTPPGVKPPPVTPGGGVSTTPGAGGGASQPFVPGPGPAPGTPVFGGFGGGAPGGGYGAPPQGYPGMPPQIGPGSPVMPGGSDFRDPMASFLSAVPLMNLNMSKQIDSAMAQSGMGGNRWSTSAQNAAGQIGAENALKQSSMFTDMLTKYAGDQENRAMQAAGMGMGLGQMFDQQAQDRVTLPFAVGQYEQNRADQMADKYYSDFERNKTGWLPMFLQAASGQSGGSQGTLMPIPGEPAKPGIADWASLIGQFF